MMQRPVFSTEADGRHVERRQGADVDDLGIGFDAGGGCLATWTMVP
jgi:hypothetical protein